MFLSEGLTIKVECEKGGKKLEISLIIKVFRAL